MIEHLQKLSPETVETFLSTREPDALGIPPKLADYILQINECFYLNQDYSSVTDCARELHKRFPKISIHTCKSRVYDSIKYFNKSSHLIPDELNIWFAEQMMELAALNMQAGDGQDLREARLCKERALEYYVAASSHAVSPDRIKFKHHLVMPDMQVSRMGVKELGILEAWKESLDIINGSDLNDTEKSRMIGEVRGELNIEEIDYEDLQG